jgi:hypothetical protein
VISAERDVTLTNTGSAPLVVSAASVSGAARGDYLVSDRCQDPVPVSGTCEIGVRFAPQAAGVRPGTLTIKSNDPGSPATVSLSGTGARAPSSTSLTLAGGSVVFGSEQLEHFSVTVSAQTPGTPTGKVTVRSGTVALCTITLASGKGSCTPHSKALPVGRHTITAAYVGDGNFNPSTSTSKTLTIKS